MRDEDDLRRTASRIDGRGYGAYKELAGGYRLGALELHLDHVQGDPFAAPSRLRLRFPREAAGIPAALTATRVRRIALEDFLARRVRAAIGRTVRGGRGSGRSRRVAIDAGVQEVLERTAVRIGPSHVEARIEADLPAAGRRVLGREATALLAEELPRVAARGLLWAEFPGDEARGFVECVENQEAIRSLLAAAGLVAFVADGSILPRATGATDRPLAAGAVPFVAPAALATSVDLPNPARIAGAPPRRTLAGMGVPAGVTLIVGGGYHGKTTLLAALARGVYPHVPGDGREYVVTRADAVKIRAEDGRRVERVDIEPFIADLPGGRSTRAFRTEDASGSTSQAASIVEALEIGCGALLLDEDTSATNFMVRDARMQRLVAAAKEPITPFVDRVRELHDRLGVSTVLVMGGSGDYFDVADTVIQMDGYRPLDVTARARAIARERPTERRSEARHPLRSAASRVPVATSFDAARGRREVGIGARGTGEIVYGREPIDVRGVEQIVDPSQATAIGYAIYLAATHLMDGARTLREVVDALDTLLDAEGLDRLDPWRRGEGHPGNHARPRRFEIAAAINRLRTVRME